jgi:hypothetical protein
VLHRANSPQDLRNRQATHKRELLRHKQIEVHFVEINDDLTRLSVESDLIRTLKPEYNIINNPIEKPSSPEAKRVEPERKRKTGITMRKANISPEERIERLNKFWEVMTSGFTEDQLKEIKRETEEFKKLTHQEKVNRLAEEWRRWQK